VARLVLVAFDDATLGLYRSALADH